MAMEMKVKASIVLTHEGLKDIVSAVEDGRKIYQRMLTYTLNKIIKTVQLPFSLQLHSSYSDSLLQHLLM